MVDISELLFVIINGDVRVRCKLRGVLGFDF